MRVDPPVPLWVGGHIREHGFMGSNPIKLNSIVRVDNLLNSRTIEFMGTKMSTKLAMLEAYEQSETNKLVAIVKLNEHLDACLDSDCCARCDNLKWRVLHYNTELEILLEDIKAL